MTGQLEFRACASRTRSSPPFAKFEPAIAVSRRDTTWYNVSRYYSWLAGSFDILCGSLRPCSWLPLILARTTRKIGRGTCVYCAIFVGIIWCTLEPLLCTLKSRTELNIFWARTEQYFEYYMTANAHSNVCLHWYRHAKEMFFPLPPYAADHGLLFSPPPFLVRQGPSWFPQPRDEETTDISGWENRTDIFFLGARWLLLNSHIWKGRGYWYRGSISQLHRAEQIRAGSELLAWQLTLSLLTTEEWSISNIKYNITQYEQFVFP